jgi:hypothetical protein
MIRRLILILFAIPNLAISQLYIGPSFAGRVSTVSFFETRNKADFNARPGLGFDAGLMVSRRMKEKYILNAQLLYSHKTKLVVGESDPLYKNKLVGRYLELPIAYTLEFKRNMGETHAGLSKTYKWFVGAGPTVSYWMGGKGKLQSSELKEVFIDHLDYKVTFNKNNNELTSENAGNTLNVTDPKRFQFSLNFTGGVALEPVGFQKIVIAAHLEIGQTFFSEENLGFFPGSEVDFDPQRSRFHSLRFSVGYLFDTQIEKRKRGKSTINNKSAANMRKKKKR